jgi:multicomponent Na+:H+ antiporter subunit E
VRRFAWTAALAVLWASLTGRLTGTSLVIGLVLGSLVLQTTGGVLGLASAAMRTRHLLELLLVFLWELLLANLRVAWDVITPRPRMRPGVVAVPLTARTDVEITMLANMISLTPGTHSLDVSSDRRFLFVHAMYLHDRDRLVRGIKDGFERRLLQVLR